MADTGSQLESASARPILAFGPTEQSKIPPKPPGERTPFRPVKRPKTDRQGRRIAPQFAALREALENDRATITDVADSSDPEHIIVLEVVGAVAGFIRATEGVEGLNFVADLIGSGYDPDEDFFYVNKEGDVEEDRVPQTLYLVMANSRAITELIRLFDLYREHDGDITFEIGLNPLKEVFSLLHTIRRWGPQDRVAETGLLESWRESLQIRGQSGSERVEIELAWATTPEARAAVQSRVERVIDRIPNSRRLSVSVIPAIQYHALLVDLPPTFVDEILQVGPEAVELLRTEEILFLAPAAPMTVESVSDAQPKFFDVDPQLPSGDPVVALLDGLPLANHEVLRDRLLVNDPEGRGEAYSTAQCGHGSAMASLIIHGDLSDPLPALRTPLYAEPILEPHEFFPTMERTPAAELFVDVVHAAFQRLLGGDAPLAPTVKIVNLSIGEPARMFTRRMSPLARLLDHVMATFNVLVVVSAGNHPARRVGEPGPKLVVSSDAVGDPAQMEAQLRGTLFAEARNRGLLAPAETINGVTVGATQDDGSKVALPDSILEPTARGAVAAYSPSGFGFRRSPKPDLHVPGGRLAVVRPVEDVGDHVLEPASTAATGPGLLVAAPTPVPGSSGGRFSYGTSNAAALTTHHAASVLDELVELRSREDGWDFPAPEFDPILAKTLLVHATSWPAAATGWASDFGADGARRRRALTQHLGFGVLDPSRLTSGAAFRAVVIGAGELGKDKRRSFRFPLPPSLSSFVGWRRLTVTLCWFSPIASRTQQYRIAHLEFGSPRDELRVQPVEVDHNANGNGTVLHEVLEGDRAAGYTADDVLAIDVDCRVRVSRLFAPVRFGLAATLEVGQDVRIDVHAEVRDRLRAEATAARVRPTARG